MCLPDGNLGIAHLPTLTLFWELTPGLFIDIEDHNFPSQKPHSTVSEWVGEWMWARVPPFNPCQFLIFHTLRISAIMCVPMPSPLNSFSPSTSLFWKPRSSEMARGSRLCLKVRMFTLAILSSNDCWRCVWGHWDEKGWWHGSDSADLPHPDQAPRHEVPAPSAGSLFPLGLPVSLKCQPYGNRRHVRHTPRGLLEFLKPGTSGLDSAPNTQLGVGSVAKTS